MQAERQYIWNISNGTFKRPGWTWGVGLRPKLNFFGIWSSCMSNYSWWHMQQHGSTYFAHRHTLDPEDGVKRSNHISLKVVMLHIKLKVFEHRAPWKQICCHYTLPRPLWWGQKVFFLKLVILYIKLKWKKCIPTCNVTRWIYTYHWPLGFSWKVRYCNCVDVSINLN